MLVLLWIQSFDLSFQKWGISSKVFSMFYKWIPKYSLKPFQITQKGWSLSWSVTREVHSEIYLTDSWKNRNLNSERCQEAKLFFQRQTWRNSIGTRNTWEIGGRIYCEFRRKHVFNQRYEKENVLIDASKHIEGKNKTRKQFQI